MNKSQISGSIDQGIGKAKSSVGNATCNESLSRKGAAQQLKGDAKLVWGKVKESADELIANANTAIGNSKDVAAVKQKELRTKVMVAAQQFTDEITGKLDQFNRNQKAKREGKNKAL